jgi:hypothetical protein
MLVEKHRERPARGVAAFPLDLALVVQYARQPIWVTAWVGRRVTRVHRTDTEYVRGEGTETRQPIEWRSLSISFGMAAGVDLMTLGNHHVGVVLDYARGGRATRDTILQRSDEGDRFSTWTLGVADRWWPSCTSVSSWRYDAMEFMPSACT